jgi:hypothetical protein
MEEKGVERNMKGLSRYLQWLQTDIVREEKGFIEEHGIGVATLRIEIAKIWYVEKLDKWWEW